LKDLVCVAGWGFDSRVWQPVAERLADDFRITCELDAVPAGAVVCGWSLGSLRALKKSAVATRLDKLILVAATPRFVQAPDWPCAQPPDLLESFAAAVAADPQAGLKRFAALMNQGDEHARDLTRSMHELLRERIPDAATLAAGLAELRDTDLKKSVMATRLPTLLVHGEHDPLMPLAAAEWLAANMPNARLEVFAGAAHAPFLSDPDRFAQLVREFAQ
jgi:pimeloyl-[acyl-carrier protein] methyl ester esterase